MANAGTAKAAAPSVQPAPSKPPKNNPAPPSAEQTADAYESTHVHTVYEAIASHFSHTRHKPWPRVSSFLDSLPAGAVGLDVGCGNGKYLCVNRDLVILGSDRSANLVDLARKNDGSAAAPPVKAPAPVKRKGKAPKASQSVQVEAVPPPASPAVQPPPAPVRNEVVVADTLSLPYRLASADFAISIAVLHHLSTPARRRLAVRAILDCLRPGGQALLFVWALEQGSSRRGWDEDAPQDQLVPWVTKGQPPPKAADAEDKADGDKAGGDKDATWHRYYHLYKEGELDDDIRSVGGEIIESGYERDNWWSICARPLDEAVA